MPNGKVYIGTTKQEKLYKRWDYGQGYVSNKPFYEDILKYGWNNIKQEVVEEVETLAEAHIKEREYILQHNSNNPEFGYNVNVNVTGKLTKKHKYVRCKGTGELFRSLREAGERYGVSHSAIDYAIKRNGYSAGYLWDRVELSDAEYAACQLDLS